MIKNLKDLKRIESKKWMFLSNQDKKVILTAPNFRAAQYAASILNEIKKATKFKVVESSQTTFWKFKRQKKRGTFFLSKIAFLRKYPDLSIDHHQVKQIKFLFYKPSYRTSLFIPNGLFSFPKYVFDPNRDFSEKLGEKPYQDSFTQIASDYFQKISPYFTYPKTPQDQYAITYTQNELHLIKWPSREPIDHAKTWQTYKTHLIETFGLKKVEVISHRFEINIDEKIRQKKPLFPEYVYRFNLGLNNIEMEDIELLFARLANLYSNLKKEASLPSFLELFKKYGFTLRELRQLRSQVKHDLFPTYLNEIFSSVNKTLRLRDLSPRLFHRVLKLLMTPSAYFDNLFTGKKIVHKSISSYYTVGSKKHFKPWIDQQELLQVFKKLKHAKSWKSYFELLTHVVAKKHLIRKHPETRWSIGALIPAPLSLQDEERWYFVESWVEDNQGDFNYILCPASKKECSLPLIKLYRSTAANSYNMFGWNSITSDLSLNTAPGSINRYAADEYELPPIQKHTLALWVAYIYLASQYSQQLKPHLNKSKITCDFLIKKAYKLAPKSIQDLFGKSEQNALTDKSSLTAPLKKQLLEKFIKKAQVHGEWINQKIERDIAFVGHSLGGALAQGSIGHYIVNYQRLPLPGCKCICYSSDAPGLSKHEVNNFWDFIHQYESLIQSLNIRLDLISQFEYGDLVMQSGTLHLGSLKKRSLPHFVHFDQSIFKPLKKATAKTITTLPTHGRRIGFAKPSKDYELTALSPLDLYEFDQALFLSRDQRQIFGFSSFVSPQLFEQTRRGLSILTYPIRLIIKKTWQAVNKPRGHELRDSKGFAHLSYTSPIVKPRKVDETLSLDVVQSKSEVFE